MKFMNAEKQACVSKYINSLTLTCPRVSTPTKLALNVLEKLPTFLCHNSSILLITAHTLVQTKYLHDCDRCIF